MNRIDGLTPRKETHLLSGDLDARVFQTLGANAYEELPETPPLDEKRVPLERHRRNGDQERYLGTQVGRRNGR
jgi:hypothetical protein